MELSRNPNLLFFIKSPNQLKRNSATEYNLIQAVNNYFKTLNNNTRQVYVKAINQFLEYHNIGMNNILSITKKDVLTFAKNIFNKYRNSTGNLKLTSIRQLYAELERLIKGFKSPFSRMSKAELNQVSRQTDNTVKNDSTLNKTKINQVLDYFNRMYQDTDRLIYFRNKIIFRFLAVSGLRISELINAKKNNLININDVYYLRITGKGNKERSIIIPDDLLNDITAYNQIINNQSEYLLIKSNGKKLNRTELYKMINRVCKKVLSRNISPHQLRHSFATRQLIDNGRSLTAVSNYLGHSNTNITASLYVHDQLSKNDINEF